MTTGQSNWLLQTCTSVCVLALAGLMTQEHDVVAADT